MLPTFYSHISQFIVILIKDDSLTAPSLLEAIFQRASDKRESFDLNPNPLHQAQAESPSILSVYSIFSFSHSIHSTKLRRWNTNISIHMNVHEQCVLYCCVLFCALLNLTSFILNLIPLINKLTIFTLTFPLLHWIHC